MAVSLASWQLFLFTVGQAWTHEAVCIALGKWLSLSRMFLEAPLNQKEGKRAAETASTCLLGFRKVFLVSCRFEVRAHNRGPNLSHGLWVVPAVRESEGV